MIPYPSEGDCSAQGLKKVASLARSPWRCSMIRATARLSGKRRM